MLLPALALLAAVPSQPAHVAPAPPIVSAWIEVKVASVAAPDARKLCRVDGEVTKVRQGRTHRVGQKIALSVPCSATGLRKVDPAVRGMTGPNYELNTLRAIRAARVTLDARGRVISYEAIDGLTPAR